MLYIAHRGLLNGPSPHENAPWVIEEAITVCGNAEVDVWLHHNELWLGHDKPTYRVPLKWFHEHQNELWIHCKNVQAAEFFNEFHNLWHYFWHENDHMTITSKGFLWVYPGKQIVRGSIAVLPELHDDDITYCAGICTDYVLKYRGDL
jgi:hypothetical protein